MSKERILSDLRPRQVDVPKVGVTEGFVFDGQTYDVKRRLSREGGLAARYEAVGEAGGKVCLTVFPMEAMMAHFIRFSTNVSESVDNLRKRFMTEPPILQRLSEIEETLGTHYFPRLLSNTYGEKEGVPSYLIEFIEGADIRTVPKDQRERYKEAYLKAMEIAHGAGVHFADIQLEDLRVLPDGKPMIIDFNSTEYEGETSDQEARKLDLERLQRLFNELEEA